jgi:hypothetical protein
MSGECENCQGKRLSIHRYAAGARSPSHLLSFPFDLARSTTLPDLGDAARYGGGHNFSHLRVGGAASGGTSGDRAVSQPGDRSEVEADRAADQVMRALWSPVFERKQEAPALSQEPPLIQREVGDEGASEMETSTESEIAAPEETPAPGLIVEDDASEIWPGQMRKSDFLARLYAEIYDTADEILVTRGRTAQSCPYITNWFEYGYTRSGSYVETFIRRFAPGSERVASASEYIPLAVERLRRALLVWADTGEITGVPESLAGDLPATKQRSAVASVGERVGAEGEVAPAEDSTTVLAKAHEGGLSNDVDPRALQNQLRAGETLDGSVKTRMERAFGYDFSRVRVHHDAGAARLSTSLNARAFTIGSDIAFGAGEYRPGTLIGDAILAHELAHVVQQGGGSASNGPARKDQTRYSSLEEDADNAAVGAVVSLWGGAKGKLGEISRNAMPRLKSGLRLQRCPDCFGEKEQDQAQDGGTSGGAGQPTQPQQQTEPAVRITSADLATDQISVELSPAETSGDLTLQMTGTSPTHTIRSVTGASGARNETFDVPTLPVGEFDNIRATWRVGSTDFTGDFPFHIKVLGSFRHSQYNIPHEDRCGGDAVNAYITNAACRFTRTTLRQRFVDQVNLNGSGVSTDHGNVQREGFCVGRPGAPEDAADRSFRGNAVFHGACGRNTGDLNNNTVARCPTHPDLGCDDRVFINTVGVKTVTDNCPACCGHDQLDNFTTDGACAGIRDLGQFPTIKLF